MRKIDLNPFDATSVRDVIKELNELKKKYRKLEKKICLELAQIGRDVAQPIYDKWSSAWNNAPVVVEAVPTTEGASILANGKSVCFLEFGSGATADGREFEGITFSPGSWSRSEFGSRMYANLDCWFFQGEKFTYIPPANALEAAVAAMRERMSEVVDRVMREADA